MALSEPPTLNEQISIRIEDVHVRYRVVEDRQLGFVDLVRRGFRSRASTEVHALRGVSATINVGESVGIVGRNGSGKSTLLRCIAGVEPMASGRVLVRGQAQLLAVNAALDGKLSGRRNVLLGGLAMGLRRADIEARMDEVISFAELENDINRPMRTYSSGMKARLTFAIATMSSPPILLIDEALAVGDRQFRNKSLDRLRSIQQNAGTLIMVTHNSGEIRSTCQRALWIDKGELRADGPAEEVVELYESVDS